MVFKKELITINGEETCKYFVDGDEVDFETYDELLEQDYIDSEIEREECEDALDLVNYDKHVNEFLIDSCIDILDKLNIEYCEDCLVDHINCVGSSMTPVFMLGYLYGRGIYNQ